jgi:hypothetical protein
MRSLGMLGNKSLNLLAADRGKNLDILLGVFVAYVEPELIETVR